jgi:peptidyl-prolyl cis-trans isomerase C
MMLFPQATRHILAGLVILCLTAIVDAQAPLAKQTPPSSSVSAQILPANVTNNMVAATVNGEKILVAEVRKILDERPYPMALTDDQKKHLRQAALEVLIEDVVMRQYLSKQVPQVSQAEFNKEVQDYETALKNMKSSIAEELKKSGLTREQLSNDIAAKLRWRTLLRQYYPDDKLKGYYDANKPYFDKMYVQASHILVKLPPQAGKEQIAQARARMQIWRQDIITGKMKFADVAKQYSECPSKKDGGDIGKFPYKFAVVPEFARTAFSMRKGEISDVVQTVFGLHLIMVTDIDQGEASNFENVREFVREVWAQDDELYPRLVGEQRKAAKVDKHDVFK